jgi:flagellar basal-body rod modification protein FlgD
MLDALQGLNASDPVSLGAPEGPAASQDLGQDAFMKLLVTQLQNQDPTSPTSNEQFITQLAEFSALEEMQGVNENLVALALLQQGNALMSQLTNSSALIGKSVKYSDPVSGQETLGTVGSVKIQDGEAVLRIDGTDVPLGNVTEVTGDTGTDANTDAADSASEDLAA